MDGNRSRSGLSSPFDDFLFATIGEDGNGMQLSVLSALARVDVDPWEEAMRLAAMPKNVAQGAMVSMLDRVPGRNWAAADAEQIAARLVRLLPPGGNAEKAPEIEIERFRKDSQVFWLVMTVIFVAMSLMSPKHQLPSPSASVSTTQSETTAQSETRSRIDPVSGTNRRQPD